LDWAAQPAWLWSGLLCQVIGGGFLGWLAWGWAVERRGVARTAPLIYLMPLIAGITAWAVGSEPFSADKLLGAAVILTGVALAQFSPSMPRELKARPDA
ncbi:MAG: DMT family transporter, partial [Roseateles sp.]